MQTIDAKRHSYEIAEKKIATLEVADIGFVAYSKLVTDAWALARDNKDGEKRSLRARMRAQVTAIADKGERVALTDEAISKMPFKLALAVRDALDRSGGDSLGGTVLNDGDGVSAPIHVRLGSPLTAANDVKIAELEFRASTMGELEDVMVAGDRASQMIALLAIAKPVDSKLLALPSWAVDRITMADGLFLMGAVLDRFLDPSDETSSGE